MSDRTPQQMREDSSMWSRAGYPGVAVGRYRAAAEQIQRLNKRVAETDTLRTYLNCIMDGADGGASLGWIAGMCRSALRLDPIIDLPTSTDSCTFRVK
jgi:hypothetical protein